MTSITSVPLGTEEHCGPPAGTVIDQGGLLVSAKSVPAARAGSDRPGQSRQVLSPDDVAYLVETAARAPSIHNTQPWKFRITGDVIELHADRNRMLRYVDPTGRELMMSCGAALFGLRLGLRKLGFLASVRLLPDSSRPSLVARVHAEGLASATRMESELLAAIPHRHTHRGPFSPGEVPVRLLQALQTDAAAEGAVLTLVSEPRVIAQLTRLIAVAAEEQAASPDIVAESAAWARPAGSDAHDGVPARARVDLETEPAATRLPQRDFGEPGVESRSGEPPSVTAVLSTSGDTPVDWLRAGQAMHRLLLHAATRWVFAGLQSQPLETENRRGQVAALLRLRDYPQMLLQFGRANIAPATPRRPPAELIYEDEEERG